MRGAMSHTGFISILKKQALFMLSSAVFVQNKIKKQAFEFIISGTDNFTFSKCFMRIYISMIFQRIFSTPL